MAFATLVFLFITESWVLADIVSCAVPTYFASQVLSLPLIEGCQDHEGFPEGAGVFRANELYSILTVSFFALQSFATMSLQGKLTNQHNGAQTLYGALYHQQDDPV